MEREGSLLCSQKSTTGAICIVSSLFNGCSGVLDLIGWASNVFHPADSFVYIVLIYF